MTLSGIFGGCTSSMAGQGALARLDPYVRQRVPNLPSARGSAPKISVIRAPSASDPPRVRPPPRAGRARSAAGYEALPDAVAFLRWAAERYVVGVTTNTPVRTVETVRAGGHAPPAPPRGRTSPRRPRLARGHMC